MDRFEARAQHSSPNPNAAVDYARHPYVVHETLPAARPDVPCTIHMNWRRWAFLPPGVIILLLCILSLVSILTPGTSLFGMTFAVLVLLGFMVLPIFLLRSITIELTEDRIRQRDMPLAMNEMPYSTIQKITIDQRIINIRGNQHACFLVIHDKQEAKMQIDMVQFRHQDLRTIINTIIDRAPHVRLDANTRAFQTGKFLCWY